MFYYLDEFGIIKFEEWEIDVRELKLSEIDNEIGDLGDVLVLCLYLLILWDLCLFDIEVWWVKNMLVILFWVWLLMI